MNNPQSDTDYQKLLSEVIKKQIVILGPDITLAKARNVKGLTISDDGTVTAISGSPQVLTQQLVEQFMELSGLIVKKTMEPLLANYPDGIKDAATGNTTGITQGPPVTPPMPQPTATASTPPAAPQPVPSAPSPSQPEAPTPGISNNQLQNPKV